MDNLNEGLLNKIVDWAKKLNPQDPKQKAEAEALSAFMQDPKMQKQMQIVATNQLVAEFAQAVNKIKDDNAKKQAVKKFFNEWKTKTDPAVLAASLKKYKLL